MAGRLRRRAKCFVINFSTSSGPTSCSPDETALAISIIQRKYVLLERLIWLDQEGILAISLLGVLSVSVTARICKSCVARFETYLENREDGKMLGIHWYSYGRTQALESVRLP
jgi:hypothetical protein